MKKISVALLVLGLSACVREGSPEVGLAPSDPGFGPMVKWDLHAKPLPEIPFPNDAATFPDPDSPTGKRINAGLVAPTALETDARKHLDDLDGFGIFAPLTVEFDKPLDLHSLHSAMKGDDDFADDPIYVINLNPASPRYGKPQILDVGNGNFPVVLYDKTFFNSDDRAGESNLVYETTDETVTGDTNHDGVISTPNVLDPTDDPESDPMTFYERATDTLIFRPLLPMDEESTYAVVITKRLTGEDGAPVRSPFEWVNDLHQTAALRPLVDDHLLENLGVSTDDIAFAWTFTTQSTTHDLVAIRQGVEGYGPFASLQAKYPPVFDHLDLMKDQPTAMGSMYVLDGDKLRGLLRDHYIDLYGGNQDELDRLLLNYQYVDYVVAGAFPSPTFVREDGVFHVNPKTGQYEASPGIVTWAMAIPRKTAKHQPPFPVTVQIHGYTSSRLELLAWAGTYCRFGSAVIVMDAWGHGGGIVDDSTAAALKLILGQYGMSNASVLFTEGRAKDLNNDGRLDNGGDFWTADIFHTRDACRQTAVDVMQLIRIFRSFDGVHRWNLDLNGDGVHELAGDFNDDGVVDVGGPYNRYAVAGGSLGGIMAGIIPAVEPYISEGVAVSGAAGLPDVAIRSTQGGVNEAVLLRILGPLVIGYPDADNGNEPTLAFQVPDVNDAVKVPFHTLTGAQPGDRVEAENLSNGKTGWSILAADLSFRINLAADAGDRVRVTIRQGGNATDPVRMTIDTNDRKVTYQGHKWAVGSNVESPTNGYGIKRQTPDFRRFVTLAGIGTEPGDPVAFAPHYFLEPLQILPSGPHAVNMMIIPTIGDHAVPVTTGIEMARAAGLIAVTRAAAEDPQLSYGRPVDWDGSMGFENWYATKLDWDQWREKEGLDWAPGAIDPPKSPNDVLLANHVNEGVAPLRRFEHDPRFNDPRPILYDVDRLSGDVSEFGQPWIQQPLQITRRTSVGISAVRIPYMNPNGQHGFGLYAPDRVFDMPTYMHSLLGHYFESGAQELIDTPCNATADCDFIPPPLIPSSIGLPSGTPTGQ